MSESLVRRRRVAVLALPGLLLGFAPGAAADDFHLKSGGIVAGDLIETTDAGYRVRTTVGSVLLPRDAVERIEPAESPLKEYDRRLADTPDTPAGWVALAEWCAEQRLPGQCRKHLLRAIGLDPNHEAARKALGYVRVGGLWVEARSVVEHADASDEQPDPEQDAEPPADDERLVRAIQSQWSRQIGAIQTNLLNSSIDRLIQEGRKRILDIQDPLAILPLVRRLSTGKYASRDVLVDSLASFPQDESTLNLAVLTLIEPELNIRRRAVAVLVKRDDPRVVAQFREALHARSSALVGRAAQALGALKAPAAVPDLIDALHVERRQRVEVPVPFHFGSYPVTFSTPTTVAFGGSSTLSHTPSLGFDKQAWAAGPIGGTNRWEVQDVTVYRTDVLEALKAITGQNFGFDSAAWRRWHHEEGP